MSSAGEWHRHWRQLPLAGLNDIIGTGTCLILAPHPDDESLGCGGLIATCVAAGRLPLVVVLTDGAGSHPGSRAFPPDRLRAVRADEARTALAQLGLGRERLVFLGQPDTAAPVAGPAFEAVVAALAGLVEADCTAILAPWRHDPHCDHEAASMMASSVAAQVLIRHVAYPVWGWTLPAETPVPGAPSPGFRLDVEPFLASKRRAIAAHQSQYGDLITDDPNGFRLPDGLLSVFDMPFETFFPA